MLPFLFDWENQEPRYNPLKQKQGKVRHGDQIISELQGRILFKHPRCSEVIFSNNLLHQVFWESHTDTGKTLFSHKYGSIGGRCPEGRNKKVKAQILSFPYFESDDSKAN